MDEKVQDRSGKMLNQAPDVWKLFAEYSVWSVRRDACVCVLVCDGS